LGLRRIEAEVNTANAASNALLGRVGFALEGTLRQRWTAKGATYDTHLHGCLLQDWQRAQRRETEGLAFRPLTRDDLGTLHAWVQRPHVAEWWPQPRTRADIERDYLPTIDGRSSTRACIACLDGEPVGFIQSYVVQGSGDGWWEGETDPGARGIDQFLADPGRLGRGLGAAMVNAFVDRLFQDPAVTRVQTDPHPANARAVRCYAKAGFATAGPVDTPDGPALLMVRERADRA
jgi:RimJ/RimL family protein N-acetyltransferase